MREQKKQGYPKSSV